jgi:cytoskeleton protein RodZ
LTQEPREASEARSAGAMLRAARERQGLHIAALAAAIKVPQAKLEALESGRYESLTDATFVRALAQSVCRVLKIDAKPVLELLPSASGAALERVNHGLKAPFQDRPGRNEPGEARLWHQPVFWFVVLLLLAAAAFVLWPQRASLMSSLPAALGLSDPAIAPSPMPRPTEAKPAVRAAEAAARPPAVASTPAEVVPQVAVAPAAPTPVITETVHSAPTDAAAATAADTPAGVAVVRTSEPSWVEAQDARGNVLLSRTLQPGESVGLDGPLPLRLVIGNAPATEVTMRGKRITLGAPNRENVVRVELK